jgi:Pyruvate/2-oxoacid:ferredoxin oxidoreductase gamma subunit
MDLCATAAAAGAAWVFRATTFDKDLADVLAHAITQPGFAMVDVWELCLAYYAPRNRLRKSDLFALLDGYGFQLGLVKDDPRPEYSARYREAFEAGKEVLRSKARIEPSFTAAVERQTGLLLAGSAGQKIKSAATLFAEAGIASDLYATQKDDYPITVMTGHSVAEIVLSPEPIEYTGIDQANYVVAVSQDGVNRTRAAIASLPPTSTVYADNALDLPATAARVLRLPFVDTAQKVSKLSIGFVALGAMLADSGLYPVAALEATIRTFQRDKIADANCRALAAGVELAGPDST